MGGAFLLLHYWMTQDDSGSIPAASYPCPHAVVFHHAGPQATVSRLPAPEASVYQRVRRLPKSEGVNG